jgi:hypothetical protein
MSITSAKSGATGISLALDNNFMEPIASTLVGSGGVGIITFNDIPQTYKHLHLRVLGRSTNAASGQSMSIVINNDTSSGVYYFHRLRGTGSSALSDAYADEREVMFLPAANIASSIFAGGTIDILDYTNVNKNKTVRTLYGYDTNGGGQVSFQSELYVSTTPINTLSFVNNFAQYSRISLYGIKG